MPAQVLQLTPVKNSQRTTLSAANPDIARIKRANTALFMPDSFPVLREKYSREETCLQIHIGLVGNVLENIKGENSNESSPTVTKRQAVI